LCPKPTTRLEEQKHHHATDPTANEGLQSIGFLGVACLPTGTHVHTSLSAADQEKKDRFVRILSTTWKNVSENVN